MYHNNQKRKQTSSLHLINGNGIGAQVQHAILSGMSQTTAFLPPPFFPCVCHSAFQAPVVQLKEAVHIEQDQHFLYANHHGKTQNAWAITIGKEVLVTKGNLVISWEVSFPVT